MRRPIAILAIATSLALLAPATASALTLRPGHLGLTQIGRFQPLHNATLGRAIRVFGPPTSRHGGGSACSVRWRKYRLHFLFANFGGRNACSRHGGLAQRLRGANSRRWQTSRHLRVGQRVSRLHRLYPSATRHRSRWWLKTAIPPFANGVRYPVLAARTHHGRLRGFKGWIGAAGD
jgi:hypothetical protein